MPKRPKHALPEPKIVNGFILAVYIGGQRKTFGNCNDPAAWGKYHEFLRTWRKENESTPDSSTGGVSINQYH